MSSYFTVPLFARAKKNQEDLQKSNPQDPVLKDEDEKFLERQISTDETKDRIIFSPTQTSQPANTASTEQRPASSGKKQQWDEGMELPSQEEAERITHNYHLQSATKQVQKPDNADSSSSDKRTWASYLPTIPNLTKKDAENPDAPRADSPQDGPSTQQRTWTQYATSYLPPALKPARTDADAAPTPIYNADGSLNEAATKAQQENELAVLLSQLNASTLNNRVFALSSDTQRLYARFAQALRDTITGVPTAYDDMDALMRDAGPTLEAQFRALPPFLQSLVRSLPSKLSTAVAPELLAVATRETPDAELKAAAEGKKTTATSAGGGKTAGGKKAKRRRRIPGLKSLVSKEGALAGMLRGAVEFVRVRFPFLASTTNVVMSLAVFILMFVCWYCHKRGKEVRLAKAAEAAKEDGSTNADGDATQEDDTESGSEDDEIVPENPELEAKIEKEIDERLQQETSDPHKAD